MPEGDNTVKKKKVHRLDISLEDVSKESGRTMHEVYTDVKRGKIDKSSLRSVVDYILRHNPSWITLKQEIII